MFLTGDLLSLSALVPATAAYARAVDGGHAVAAGCAHGVGTHAQANHHRICKMDIEQQGCMYSNECTDLNLHRCGGEIGGEGAAGQSREGRERTCVSEPGGSIAAGAELVLGPVVSVATGFNPGQQRPRAWPGPMPRGRSTLTWSSSSSAAATARRRLREESMPAVAWCYMQRHGISGWRIIPIHDQCLPKAIG
jgi:hypothetical protein